MTHIVAPKPKERWLKEQTTKFRPLYNKRTKLGSGNKLTLLEEWWTVENTDHVVVDDDGKPVRFHFLPMAQICADGVNGPTVSLQEQTRQILQDVVDRKIDNNKAVALLFAVYGIDL